MIELKYLSKTFQMKDGAVKALQNINLARNKFHAIFRCSFHMGMNIDQIAY